MTLATTVYQDPAVRSQLYVNGQNIVFPVGSDRKNTEALSKVPNGKLRRTMNRKAIFIRNTTQGTDLYKIRISGNDLKIPALDQAWNGTTVLLSPVTRLVASIAAGATSVTLARTPLSNTIDPAAILVFDTVTGQPVTGWSLAGLVVTLAAAQANPVTVEYRFISTWMISSEQPLTRDVLAAKMTWATDLEELGP